MIKTKMKPSYIAWIGDIPSDWATKKLRFASLLRNETGYYTSDQVYVGLENIEGSTGRYIKSEAEYEDGTYDVFFKGDVLFNKLRPYLAKALIPDFDGFCTGELLVFKDFEGDKRFLFYFVLSHGFIEIVNASTYGAKMPRASWDYIKNLHVTLPSKAEQQLISNFLDEKCGKIDSIIADKEKQVEVLNQYKNSLITETVIKGLDKFAPMKNSGIERIGMIPEDFEMIKLKYLLKKSKNAVRVGPFGSELTNDDYMLEGKWVYTQRTVLDNEFEENDTFISEEKFKELRGFSVKAGDILITTRGTIGKA